MDWVLALWRGEQPAQAFGSRLLAASALPPGYFKARGRQVCSCFDISEPQIREALCTMQGTPDRRLAQLQQQLRCGTNCGSCKPALQVLVSQSLEAA